MNISSLNAVKGNEFANKGAALGGPRAANSTRMKCQVRTPFYCEKFVKLCMGDCHGASDTRLLIHKFQLWCEASTFNAGFTAPSALWMCFITFDLPSFAGFASFTQGSHSMEV